MEINLSKPKKVTVTPAVEKTVEKVTVVQLVDQPILKRVIAVTREVGQVILWEEDAYDSIGQWTDTQAQDRLKEVLGA